MKKIVWFIILLPLLISCGRSRPLVTVGVATDMHFDGSADRLVEAIDTFNARSTDFNVFLGDFIKSDIKEAGEVSAALSTCAGESYCLLGDSDFVAPYGKPLQDSIMHLLNVKKPYYSIDFGTYRFIFMDSNDNSTYSRAKGCNEWKEALDHINALWGEGSPYARPFNGSVGADQYSWLEDRLKDAIVGEKKVVVFSHQPLALFNVTHNQLDGRVILRLFAKYPCVKACFSGHHHFGAMATYGDLHNFVFKSMGAYPQNSFAIIKVFKNKIEVEGFGDQPGAVLKLR